MIITASRIEERTGLTGVTLTSGGGLPPSITATGDADVIERVNRWLARNPDATEMPTGQSIANDETRETQARNVLAALETDIEAGAPATQANAANRILRLERIVAFMLRRELKDL
jgi:hypothetical protein